jgi:hypothetical protein
VIRQNISGTSWPSTVTQYSMTCVVVIGPQFEAVTARRARLGIEV